MQVFFLYMGTLSLIFVLPFLYVGTGTPNSSKFRGGCRFDKGGGYKNFMNFYAIKI